MPLQCPFWCHSLIHFYFVIIHLLQTELCMHLRSHNNNKTTNQKKKVAITCSYFNSFVVIELILCGSNYLRNFRICFQKHGLSWKMFQVHLKSMCIWVLLGVIYRHQIMLVGYNIQAFYSLTDFLSTVFYKLLRDGC